MRSFFFFCKFVSIYFSQGINGGTNAHLCTAELLLLLRSLNLISHRVEFLLLLTLLLQTRSGTLSLNPVVTRGSHLAVHDSPDFLSKVLGELGGVSNDDDTTLERLDGLGKGTERVTVKVVGGLVEDDQVRTLPRASGENDLDTLTTRQTAHARVRNQLSIETEVGAVLLNLLADKGTELTTGESLLLIDLSDHLGVGRKDLVTGNPGIVGSHHGSPLLVLHANVLSESERALVLVRVLELPTGVDTDDATLGTLDLVDLVHGLLVLFGDDLVGTVHGLTVLTSLETPLDVLGRSLVQVVINVRESVLLDVRDTDVLVLVDITGGGDKLTSQNVDKGGLSGTVGTNDGNTRAERALEGDLGDLGLGGTGVLEGHVVDTDDSLGLGLDTLKETGLGELELHLGGTELVVGTSRRHTLDESVKVTAVTLELEALVVNNVLDDVVQELAVVGNDNGSARRRGEVVLEPLDVLDIQVVGGLVKEQDIGLLEHSTGKSKLHLPATRERSDGSSELLRNETELNESLLDLGLGLVNTDGVELLHGPLNDGLLSIGRVEIVLDVHGLDFVLLGKTLDLLVVDGAHESGLSGTVGTKKTVTLTTLQTKVSLVEQDLGTIGQVECAVAEILALLLIRLNGILGGGTGDGALAEVLNKVLGLLITNDDGEEGTNVGLPVEGFVVLLVDELTTNGTDVVDDGPELVEADAARDDVLEVTSNGGDVTVLGDLRDLAVLDVTDTGESVQSLLGLLTGLGVSQVVVVLLQSRHQLGQESGDNLGVLDKLAHVVDDDSRLTLDGSLTLDKTTLKQGHHDGESGLVDVSDESGSTEQVNGLRDVLWLGDTLDELGNEALNILVGDETAKSLHGGVSSLLDLSLGIPHSTGDDGNQVGHTESELSRGALGEDLDALKIADLLGPLESCLKRVDDVRDDGLHRVGVRGGDDSLGGSLRSNLDGAHLVGDGVEGIGQKRHEVGLDGGRDGCVLGDGADSVKGALADDRILAVAQLLAEQLNSPTDDVSMLRNF